MTMNNQPSIDNKVFMSTIAGVVLLIISAALSLFSLHTSKGLVDAAMLFPATIGLSSIGQLYNAIKKDKRDPFVFEN